MARLVAAPVVVVDPVAVVVAARVVDVVARVAAVVHRAVVVAVRAAVRPVVVDVAPAEKVVVRPAGVTVVDVMVAAARRRIASRAILWRM